MNFRQTIPILAAASLAFSALLFQATPSFASDNVTVNVVVEQNVKVEQVAGSLPSAPPPVPPAPPTPSVPPTPPIPPAPPAPPVPPPAPIYYPSPIHYPLYSWPYEYRWSTYISPRVIVVEQPLPLVQVQTQPTVQPQINLDPPPIINSFTVDPVNIQAGQTAVLMWTVSDVLERDVTITISPGIGSVSNSGSFNVSPSSTTTYTLTATNIDGSVSANLTVSVAPAPLTAGAGIDGDNASNVLTGWLGGGTGSTGYPWLPYILLLGLLAAAATAIILLVTKRNPSLAYAGARTGYQPSTNAGTETSIPHTTTASGAKFLTTNGEYIPISGKKGTLGRDDFLSVVTPSKADLISRQHLRITCKNNEYYIEDNNSKNGTRLNGGVITGKGSHLLRDNDMIDLGGVLTLTFQV